MPPSEFTNFAQALSDPGRAAPSDLLVPPGACLAERFAVHRNNVHVSLVDALAERHPVVLALVGEEFFRALARAFVAVHKPRTAVLSEYGAELAQFIANFGPAQSVPYLPDVARLESAWHEAWSAADAHALGLRHLAPLTPEALAGARLSLHPATRIVASPWPIADLWQAHQGNDRDIDLALLTWRPQTVLLTRPDATILMNCVPPPLADFLHQLGCGARLEHAAAASLPVASGLDAAAALRTLLQAGAFSEIHP